MDDTTLAVILWGVAVLLLGWTWVPALVSGLGGTRYATGGSDDPTVLDTANEPDFAVWQRQLAVLGYEPAGTGWMRLTFYGSAWRYETRVRAFRARDRRAFALVQRQPRPLDVWWLTTFVTVWQDGGVLVTSNAADQPPSDGDYVVQGIESTDLAAVEELHRAEAGRRRTAGHRPDSDESVDALLRAMGKHTGPEARHTGVKLGQTYLLAHAGIHAALSVPPAFTMGFAHWAVPLTNLILGALLLGSEFTARQRAGRLMRAQIAPKTSGAR